MDILVSSNLERLLYLMSGGDTAFVAALMAQLDSKGSYAIPADMLQKLRGEFWADYCSDESAKAVIAKLWSEAHYLCDPHTAAGFAAAYAYQAETGDNAPMVVLSTASPYKFPAAVLEALGQELTGDEFEQMEALAAKTGCPIPKNLANLQGKPERHTGVIDKAEMAAFALA